MEPSDRCNDNKCTLIAVGIGILILCLMILMIILFSGPAKDPTFSVESTAVKAFNLTSDGRLFCIINVDVRVHNPNKNSYDFDELVTKLKKPGQHGTIAEDKLLNVRLSAGEEALFHVAAIGFGNVALKGKVAEQVRADVAAGEGRVDVLIDVMGSNDLNVLCKDVVVDFSKSTVREQRVDCEVNRVEADV